jgi:sulfide:quinone oxidoreductase
VIYLKQSKNFVSRRDALKFIAFSPVAATLTHFSTTDLQANEHKNKKIVIVGGGAGAIMTLSRLLIDIEKPNITIIAPNDIQIYQPHQLYSGIGEIEFEDLIINNYNYIDLSKVEWIIDKVNTFQPEKNILITNLKKTIKYDYLIIATGTEYHYHKIDGLKISDIGTNGINSIYLNNLEKGTADGVKFTQDWLSEIVKFSKKDKAKILFTQPNTDIKCIATPQSMLYLCADYLKKRECEANYYFTTSKPYLHNNKNINNSLKNIQNRYKNIINKFEHNLKSIDIKNKKATFIYNSNEVVLDYDFIHIVPPMSSIQAIIDAKLSNSDGWLDVDEKNFKHKKYKNIFGVGDTCGVKSEKNIDSTRYQTEAVSKNILNLLQNKKSNIIMSYDTKCPFSIKYSATLMTNSKRDENPKPSWLWWVYELYISKPIYKYLMLTGRF